MSLQLDAKGRLAVPSRFRDAFRSDAGAGLTLTRHPPGCLMVFPLDEWVRFRDRVAALPLSAQWWKRIFLGNAVECVPDTAGRVLVSPELRAAAGIQRSAIWLGMGTHCELWDADTYAAQEAEALKGPMPEVLSDIIF